MDTLPLPPRPNLGQYKKRAKELVIAAGSSDEGAVRAWATKWLETLVSLLGVAITPFVRASMARAIGSIDERVRKKSGLSDGRGAKFTLADAQFLIAEAHGFASWAEFADHIQPPLGSEGLAFERAADAVVDGNLSTLESLLREHPALIRTRSPRVHRATLLHYVAANGVEDFRQRTPPNAVAIARFLLEHGAEVDAVADAYTGKYDTTMNLLVSSAHPAGVGLQPALVETLLDFGAAINGLEDDESPMMTALAFGYLEPAETLAKRGARVDNVLAAAALGRTDLVTSFVVDRRTLASGVPLVSPVWFRVPNDPTTHIEVACIWACKFGKTDVVDLLLEKGVDPRARDIDSMTLLHWAGASHALDLVTLLLQRGLPLEVENRWGGTVLNSTRHFAFEDPGEGKAFLPVIEMLLLAGADVSVVYFPTGNGNIDDLLRRHGARAG